MNLLFFTVQQPWAMAVSAGAHLAGGLGLGLLYFGGLRWNAQQFAAGGRLAAAIAVLLGRFVSLGALLTLASLQGALPLLAMALGVLFARQLVMHNLREGMP